MAVTKTHPIKSTLKAAIDYICNPEKTDAGDGDDDRFREAADHVEDAAIPAGRRYAHLAGDLVQIAVDIQGQGVAVFFHQGIESFVVAAQILAV